MHYETSLNTAGCKEKIVDEAVYWSTVSEINKNSFIENNHSFHNLSLPFVIIKVEFWQLISSEFPNPAKVSEILF